MVLTNSVPLLYCIELSIVLLTFREFTGSVKSMATAEGFLQSPLVVWVRRSFLLNSLGSCVSLFANTVDEVQVTLASVNLFRAIESLSLCFF